MATAYSDEVAPGGSQWNRIRIKCDYSGTSATITIQFRRTQAYSSRWYDSQASITFNGQTISAPYDYSGTVGTSWIDIDSASGFTIPTSGGTFNWSFNNPGGGAVLQCSGTIYLSSQGSPPSNGYIQTPDSYWGFSDQSVVVHSPSVGCNNGGLTLTERRIHIATSPYTDSGYPDASTYASFDFSNGQQIWCTNATRVAGSLTMIGNKSYYMGLWARNSAGYYRFRTADGAPTIVTAPARGTATLTSSNVSPTTRQFTVSLPANGGYYTQNIQYSINGGSWVTATTKTGTAAETKTVNLTGLTPNTFYAVSVRVTTTAGATMFNGLYFTTQAIDNFYGSASSVATHINKFYCLPGGPNWFLSPSTSGSTYTRNGDTDFTLSATKPSGTATNFYAIDIALKPNTQYWFSCKKNITGSTFNNTGRVRVNLENTWTGTWDDNGTIAITTGATGRLKLGFYLWSNAGTATGASATTVRWYDVCVREAEARNAFLGYVPYNGRLAKNWYNYNYLANQASGTVTAGVYPWGFYINGGPQTSGTDQRIFLGTMTLPAGTYTMKVEYISGTSNASFWVYQDQTWTRPFTDSMAVSSSTTSKVKTFTTSATATYHLTAYVTTGTISFSNYYFRVSVVSGSTAMATYEPYAGIDPGARKVRKLYGSVGGVAKPFFIRHVHD